ncbi:unnamed protein product [Pleuronectes platessa]|uniref:Uncharacterized protein n=1 Tax=Pleuronectes platessa TaxID=8262 RepID=A0A9N7V1J3_PLEPL|nr:unnamed protein product [Pleuronectes platessa]
MKTRFRFLWISLRPLWTQRGRWILWELLFLQFLSHAGFISLPPQIRRPVLPRRPGQLRTLRPGTAPESTTEDESGGNSSKPRRRRRVFRIKVTGASDQRRFSFRGNRH